jgi:hypothetical protein
MESGDKISSLRCSGNQVKRQTRPDAVRVGKAKVNPACGGEKVKSELVSGEWLISRGMIGNCEKRGEGDEVSSKSRSSGCSERGETDQ